MSDLRPRTLWISEADGWRHCPLQEGTQTLGRDMSCTVVIQHARISRRHAQIECDERGTWITDLGSANGILRNGAPMSGRQRLLPGDKLHFGPVEVRVGEQHEAFVVPVEPEPEAPAAAAPAETAGSQRIRAATRRRSSVPLILAAALFVLGIVGLWKAGILNAALLQDAPALISDTNRNAEQPTLEELVPTDSSRGERERCIAAFEAALTGARYAEAETLALSPQAPAELTLRLRAALETLVADLLRDAESIAANGPDKAAAHLRSALKLLPPGSAAAQSVQRAAQSFERQAEEIAARGSTETPAVTNAGPEQPAPAKPEETSAGAATAADLEAAQQAWQQRDLTETRRRTGTILAGRASPAIRRAAERVFRGVEDHELLADALAEGLAKVPERRWPGLTQPATLRASRTGLSAQSAQGLNSLPWKIVSADLMAAAIQASALKPDAQVAAARILHELGHTEAAATLLAKAAQREPDQRAHVDRVLADQRDLADVPAGGFQWVANAWITAADASRRLRKEDMDKDAALLCSAKPEEREAAFTRLHELGAPARASLRRGLLQARAQGLLDLRKQAGFEALERLVQQRRELDRLRAHALELIFDTTRYPYPYRPPEADAAAAQQYRENQPEVDRRVQAVRTLWDAGKPVQLQQNLRRLVARFEEVLAYAQRAELDLEEDEFDWLAQLPAGQQATLANIALNPKDRERIDTAEEVLKLNESDPDGASSGEREQCRITNAYRLMMGCWALRLYGRLIRASRGHCTDMTQRGFFAHESPVEGKRTPSDRVALEGMQPEGISENIAISGGAAAAHAAWIHSPGHHRNILMPAWRLFGPGNNGRHWCQNFSVRDRAPPEGG